jgi:nitrogen fixation/metabolism regulation signal transduction histidine kinase
LDNGIGFEQTAQKKILKFSAPVLEIRLHRNWIGLAIVKKIVDNHNGIITATVKKTKELL